MRDGGVGGGVSHCALEVIRGLQLVRGGIPTHQLCVCVCVCV